MPTIELKVERLEKLVGRKLDLKELEYDLQYTNNMSLRLDLKIFLKTVLTVLKKEGAH